MAKICVFCGSRSGFEAHWGDMAEQVGRTIARASFGVVYGGARGGLMGRMAEGALAEGGTVIGVLPQTLLGREPAHPGLTALEVVDDLAARKLRMLAQSDAFLALPGGIGTLDELFEVWTLGLLVAPKRPVAVFNHRGFFDPLLDFLDRLQLTGFLGAHVRAELKTLSDLSELGAWLLHP